MASCEPASARWWWGVPDRGRALHRDTPSCLPGRLPSAALRASKLGEYLEVPVIEDSEADKVHSRVGAEESSAGYILTGARGCISMRWHSFRQARSALAHKRCR